MFLVFAILTDGKDNRSKHTRIEMKNVIENYQKEFGAKILFIAANMDAKSVGKDYGINKNSCLQMGSDPKFSLNAMKSVTQASIRSYSNNTNKPSFTSMEREKSCSSKEAFKYRSI